MDYMSEKIAPKIRDPRVAMIIIQTKTVVII